MRYNNLSLITAEQNQNVWKYESLDISRCHWRRQLWGTGARPPLNFQLVFVIGVGAQSTLGQDIFDRKYMYEQEIL